MNIFMINLPVADIWYSWAQSNTAGKAIVFLLFIGSIFAWSVMITKIKELSRAGSSSKRFILAYRKESHPSTVFLKRQKFPDSPLYLMYEKACSALGSALESRGADSSDLFMGGVGVETRCLEDIQVSSVRNVTERTMADQALLLENNMGLLATASATAPFLGLLGTVWGVMEAFGGMAVKGSAMLSTVAPGVSGALLTTVVGLLVALPSVIGFNMLSDQIRRLTVEMDNFCQELISDIECNYLQKR